MASGSVSNYGSMTGRRSRASTSHSTASTSYPTTTTIRPTTSGSITGRSKGRPRTAASTIAGNDQQVICAISESRGISPIVGLAFVNLSTTEAVLCQISDNQTYTRTEQKLRVYEPSEILFMSTSVHPKSNLYLAVKNNLPNICINAVDRKFWAETDGLNYIQNLAIKEDLEAIKVSLEGNYYATCCFAAALKSIELGLSVSLAFHSLRIKYEPSEDSVMIDSQTSRSLELIQNSQNPKSKECLFGVLNQTLTPMGNRRLRNNMLQPSTDKQLLEYRYEALEELSSKEEIFFGVRKALKTFVDVDRVLTAINTIPQKPSVQYFEQSINKVIMLKQFIKSLHPIFDALENTTSELLNSICNLCTPASFADVEALIDGTINEDTVYQSKPLGLRHQRTFAVKAGDDELLNVARTAYRDATRDAEQHIEMLAEEHQLNFRMEYDPARQYYMSLSTDELEERNIPEECINAFRKKKRVECQTLALVKLNQKLIDCHQEVLQQSDQKVQQLINDVREIISPLFKISEAIALLDMIASFAQLVTTQEYKRPELTDTLAIKSGKHPIIERIRSEKFIPNDVYATQQSRFQIVTGCNMSGKSTYIRSIALMTVMAQIGCFVPASYASFPIVHQLFARISTDDSIEANVSTFALEMRETAFILRNIDRRSLVIIDELGRSTSTRDGLCIAIAIAEALVDSRALVFFVTHFRDLAKILAEKNGVVNNHLAVDISPESGDMKMLYRVQSGYSQDEHYGLALARVINLPAQVLATAETVSKKLKENIEKRKRSSKAVALARRRKLVLGLREQLVQAKEGRMQGVVLATWMKSLQDEFVRRMAAIDEEIASAEEEEFAMRREPEGEEEGVEMVEDGKGNEESSDSSGGRQGLRHLMSGALQPRGGGDGSSGVL